jgi:hypothetical protein
MATTDAATTAVVLRRVEEEHGRAGRVLAHRHLRAAQGSPAVSGATSAFARRRDLQALRAALDPAIVWQGLRDDLSCHGANAGFVAARDEGYDIDAPAGDIKPDVEPAGIVERNVARLAAGQQRAPENGHGKPPAGRPKKTGLGTASGSSGASRGNTTISR